MTRILIVYNYDRRKELLTYGLKKIVRPIILTVCSFNDNTLKYILVIGLYAYLGSQ
ncbi:MAG: hypothetical protein M3P08_18450 [Thermoproteota archaeon]|jgi:hypothetical protein|nr:hypothetical protein [Thermoproteota archaeon]